MNLGLRTLHERLDTTRDPVAAWHRFISAAERCRDSAGRVTSEFHVIASSLGLRGGDGEWTRDLRLLGVVEGDGTWNTARALSVGVALELVGDSFDEVGDVAGWAPVATLPRELLRTLRPPSIRHTAGVILELIDSAHSEVLLGTPFVDSTAVAALSGSLDAARSRGVDINIVTSPGRGAEFQTLSTPASRRGHLQVIEVHTEVSPIGSHAKVLAVDRRRAYVGSANLTAAGLGRHIEIGVQVEGAQVGELTSLLLALERLGTCVLRAPGGASTV